MNVAPVYLNHAGTSWPKPASVWAAHDAARDAPPDRWPTLFQDAHSAVADAFGTTPDCMHLTPGCTQALDAAVGALDWTRGDCVLTSGFEHEALMRPLRALEARGVRVVRIGPGVDGPLDQQALGSWLQTGDVRLVAISMASNVTGEALPWAEITTRSQQAGARCLLDAAQVAGWMLPNLPALGADYVAFAGHKGPQAPTGVGGLYVRDGAPRPTWCDTGSVALPALCGLAAGLQWMANDPPLERTVRLLRTFRDGAATITGVTLIGGPPCVPTCSVRLDSGTPAEHAHALAADGVIVNGSQHCAPEAHATLGTAPAGTVRFSFGPGATEVDVHAALRALRKR